jgi:WhiB family redox-sensing transcriptional regulator
MAPVTARRPWATETRRGPGGVPGRALIRTPAAGAPVLRDAACIGQDPALFFPDTDADAARAKAVCATCPALTRAICLERAEARGERFGVWGGVDFEEKARRRRQARSGVLPRGVQAMATAGRLGELRAAHGSLRAVAQAAGLSSETARFYLTLLDLDPCSQDRVRSGEITPSAAVAAVRSARRARERAS